MELTADAEFLGALGEAEHSPALSGLGRVEPFLPAAVCSALDMGIHVARADGSGIELQLFYNAKLFARETAEEVCAAAA